MAYGIEDYPPDMWYPGEQFPTIFSPKYSGQYMFHSWNSDFEYAIIKHVLKIEPPPLTCWTDTAALATAMALPSALEKCGKALDMPEDKAKDKRGSYLINKLCKPNRGKRIRDPELLNEFYDYCVQDVIAEREISKRLVPLNPFERKLWELDKEINLRGIQIDIPNVEHAMSINEKKSAQITKDLIELTGLENPNSWQQFLPWAQAQGYTGENCQAETFENFLKELKN